MQRAALQREAVDQRLARPVELVGADEPQLQRSLIEIEAAFRLMSRDPCDLVVGQQAETLQGVTDGGIGIGATVIDARRLALDIHWSLNLIAPVAGRHCYGRGSANAEPNRGTASAAHPR